MNFDITIPVLNEQNRLEPGVKQIVEFMSRHHQFEGYRLTIANNGSTDNTEQIAHSLCSKHKNVHYINVGQRGVGLALKHSWRQSQADIVGYMDVDIATDLEHMLEVHSILYQHPEITIVNGSRNLNKSVVKNRKLIRTVTSKAFNFIIRNSLKTHFTDGMCGFKFLRRESLENILKAKTADGWFFCTELLVLAEWQKLGIQDIPVRWTDDIDSRVNIKNTTIDYLHEINRLRQARERFEH